VSKNNEKLTAAVGRIYQEILTMISTTETPEQFKRITLLVNWLKKYIDMIKNENTFVRGDSPDLKRGHIVLIDLGFNIGEELGGPRPAIVLRDSPKSYSRVLVLPITSQEPKNKHLSIYVYLGKNKKGLNPSNEHWANVLNISNLSKQRIIIPPEPKKLDGRLLERISAAIINQVALHDKKTCIHGKEKLDSQTDFS